MSCRILIVDDSAVTRAVLKKTIGMVGIEVGEILQAANGKEALELLEAEDVDLVFADLNMPEMNGIEMSRHIFDNTSAEKPAPVVVVVTTEASTVRIEELKDMGVKGYVHKPFTPEQIRDAINLALQPATAN